MAKLDLINSEFEKKYLNFEDVTEFHNTTKMQSELWNRQRPRRYYDFPSDIILEHENDYETIEVPMINVCKECALQDAIMKRRTYPFNKFTGGWSKEELFTMLNLTAGITGERQYKSFNSKKEEVSHVQNLRAYPSGGGLYPVELYMYIKQISGIPDGTYVFNPIYHRLVQIGGCVEEGKLEELLPMTAVKIDPNNASLEKCNIIMFMIANFKYSSYKYGKLAYKLAILEAGHIGQNLQLSCAALGKRTTALCGFYDDKVEDFLKLDGKNKVCLYVFTIG